MFGQRRFSAFHIYVSQGAKLEIESVLRETCDRVLSPSHSVTQRTLILRATALEICGEAYMAATKDGLSVLDSEYVRIDTKSSKERDNYRQR